jgi:hypothetical protein
MVPQMIWAAALRCQAHAQGDAREVSKAADPAGHPIPELVSASSAPAAPEFQVCYVFGTGVRVMSGTTVSAPAVTANSVGCESKGSKPSAETVT